MDVTAFSNDYLGASSVEVCYRMNYAEFLEVSQVSSQGARRVYMMALLQAAWMVLYVIEVAHSQVQALRMAVVSAQKQAETVTCH